MSATATLHPRAETAGGTAQVRTAAVKVGGFAPTGPEVLDVAAQVLPAVSGQLLLSGDVHLALVEALIRLDVGTDRYHRLRLADDAADMFAAYLVGAGLATPETRPSATVRGWVVFQDLTGVRRALAGAARLWQAELASATSFAEGGWRAVIHPQPRPADDRRPPCPAARSVHRPYTATGAVGAAPRHDACWEEPL